MQNKKIIYFIVFLTAIITSLYFYKNNKSETKIDDRFSFTDATYIINGEKIDLKNGLYEESITQDSASKNIVKYFGNEVKYDFDHDGREDIAFLITQEMGGSGLFYYLVARLNKIDGPIGSEAVFIGDRIAPQTTEISKDPGKVDVIVVNYADRNPGEPMTTKPSLGKSIWLKLNTKTMQFGEVVQNFEGEADPKRMSLTMKTWDWISTQYNDGKVVKPLSPTKKFSLTFKDNKTFSATTDCNGVGGEYQIDGNKITFTKMFSTLMYCENSQESDFTKMISDVSSFFFTSKGELIMEIKYDSGTLLFK